MSEVSQGAIQGAVQGGVSAGPAGVPAGAAAGAGQAVSGKVQQKADECCKEICDKGREDSEKQAELAQAYPATGVPEVDKKIMELRDKEMKKWREARDIEDFGNLPPEMQQLQATAADGVLKIVDSLSVEQQKTPIGQLIDDPEVSKKVFEAIRTFDVDGTFSKYPDELLRAYIKSNPTIANMTPLDFAERAKNIKTAAAKAGVVYAPAQGTVSKGLVAGAAVGLLALVGGIFWLNRRR